MARVTDGICPATSKPARAPLSAPTPVTGDLPPLTPRATANYVRAKAAYSRAIAIYMNATAVNACSTSAYIRSKTAYCREMTTCLRSDAAYVRAMTVYMNAITAYMNAIASYSRAITIYMNADAANDDSTSAYTRSKASFCLKMTICSCSNALFSSATAPEAGCAARKRLSASVCADFLPAAARFHSATVNPQHLPNHP